MELHPIITHFPVAAIVFVMLAELYKAFAKDDPAFDTVIAGILMLGTICTVVAFFTGLDAAEEADITFKVPDSAVALHYNAARITLVLIPMATALRFAAGMAKHRQRCFIWLYRIVLVGAFIAVGTAGYFGGELIFSYGAGVGAKNFK